MKSGAEKILKGAEIITPGLRLEITPLSDQVRDPQRVLAASLVD